MTAQTDPPPPGPTRKQMNVRLPEDLIGAVDARRSIKGMSRDVWVENALRFALAQHGPPRTPRPATVRRPTR
jgi:predicted HicB family RNase H-like nuclease